MTAYTRASSDAMVLKKETKTKEKKKTAECSGPTAFLFEQLQFQIPDSDKVNYISFLGKSGCLLRGNIRDYIRADIIYTHIAYRYSYTVSGLEHSQYTLSVEERERGCVWQTF